MSRDAETVLRELATTRQARSDARREWQQTAARVAHCSTQAEGYESGTSPCYSSPWLEPDEWCDSCREREPAHKRFRAASYAAAAALRRAVSFGKRLATEPPDPSTDA